MAKRENGGWLLRVGLLALLAAVTVQLGCQPGSNEELKIHRIISRTPPALVAAVGIDVCGYCHTRQVGEWLTGQHGTAFVFGDGLDSVGSPTYFGGHASLFAADGTPNQTGNGHYCYECHDPQGDGRRLQPGYTGNVDRPVIGCEACHGGGAEHFGVGNIPFPKPDAERCGQCHNQDFDHNAYHPNADNIYEDYTMSGHAHSINSHNLAANGKDVHAACSRCHTDEGFRKYVSQVPGATGHDSIEDFFTGLPDLTDPSDVTCRTCHNPHQATGEDLTRIAATNVNGDTQSSEFNTCTSCHQLANADGGVLTGTTIEWAGTVKDSAILNGDSFAYHDPMINHYSNYGEVITDSHAPVPGDTRLNTGANAKALYFVKKGDDHVCAECHSPHLGSAEINRAYAESGHGDPLAEAWTHYDWKQKTGGVSGKDSRSACERCHTSTGFMNYANALRDQTVYDPNNNDYSYLLGNDDPGARIDTNDQNETLYCWACHAVTSGSSKGENSYKGELRNPGRYYLNDTIGAASYPPGNLRANYLPATQFITPMSGDTVFPDLSGSNVCIACHSGRDSGGSVLYADTLYPGHAKDTDFSNLSFKNSHYLAAGGVLFREIGYEYYTDHDGLFGDTINPNYQNHPHFEHDIIGTPAAGSTVDAIAGTNGPCVGCHLRSAPGVLPRHSFSPVALVGSTEELVSPVCAACHSGKYAMSIDVIDEQEAGFQAGMEALRQVAINQGSWYWKTCNSYVFDADCDCPGDPVVVGVTCGTAPATASKNWCDGTAAPCIADGKQNMGALFNLNMLEHEPGAFAHNRYYTKHLIYDSIDWLDDKSLNMSVGTNLPTLVSGNTLAEAQGYLLSKGLRP